MLEELCSSYDRKRGKIFDDREAISEKYRGRRRTGRVVSRQPHIGRRPRRQPLYHRPSTDGTVSPVPGETGSIPIGEVAVKEPSSFRFDQFSVATVSRLAVRAAPVITRRLAPARLPRLHGPRSRPSLGNSATIAPPRWTLPVSTVTKLSAHRERLPDNAMSPKEYGRIAFEGCRRGLSGTAVRTAGPAEKRLAKGVTFGIKATECMGLAEREPPDPGSGTEKHARSAVAKSRNSHAWPECPRARGRICILDLARVDHMPLRYPPLGHLPSPEGRRPSAAA